MKRQLFVMFYNPKTCRYCFGRPTNFSYLFGLLKIAFHHHLFEISLICDGIWQLVMGTMEDLQKLYPEIISDIQYSEMKATCIEQVCFEGLFVSFSISMCVCFIIICTGVLILE